MSIRVSAAQARRYGVKLPSKPSERSKLEAMLEEQMRIAGLPAPECEKPWALCLGRKWRSEFFWDRRPKAPGVVGAKETWTLILPRKPLAVEVEGGVWLKGGGRHNRGAGFLADLDKLNCAALLGILLLKFSGRDVKSGAALRVIESVLHGTGEWADVYSKEVKP